jgi:hypothetical protein
MGSDTSATGEIPALEPETGPTAPAARQASGWAALASGPGPHPPSPRPPAATTAAANPPAAI